MLRLLAGLSWLNFFTDLLHKWGKACLFFALKNFLEHEHDDRFEFLGDGLPAVRPRGGQDEFGAEFAGAAAAVSAGDDCVGAGEDG